MSIKNSFLIYLNSEGKGFLYYCIDDKYYKYNIKEKNVCEIDSKEIFEKKIKFLNHLNVQYFIKELI